jgi:hypothetical protein
MAIADQYTYCIGCQRNTILLESDLFWYSDHHALSLWLDIQCFFQCLITESGSNFWFLLAHEERKVGFCLPAPLTKISFIASVHTLYSGSLRTGFDPMRKKGVPASLLTAGNQN